MPILRQRIAWRLRSVPSPSAVRGTQLTAEECDNVRAAIRLLRVRYGGYSRLSITRELRPASRDARKSEPQLRRARSRE